VIHLNFKARHSSFQNQSTFFNIVFLSLLFCAYLKYLKWARWSVTENPLKMLRQHYEHLPTPLETGHYVWTRFCFKLVRDSTPLLWITHIDCFTRFTGPVGAWQRWRSWSPWTMKVLIRSSINYLSVLCLSVYVYTGAREAHAPISWILSDHHLHHRCRCRANVAVSGGVSLKSRIFDRQRNVPRRGHRILYRFRL